MDSTWNVYWAMTLYGYSVTMIQVCAEHALFRVQNWTCRIEFCSEMKNLIRGSRAYESCYWRWLGGNRKTVMKPYGICTFMDQRFHVLTSQNILYHQGQEDSRVHDVFQHYPNQLLPSVFLYKITFITVHFPGIVSYYHLLLKWITDKQPIDDLSWFSVGIIIAVHRSLWEPSISSTIQGPTLPFYTTDGLIYSIYQAIWRVWYWLSNTHEYWNKHCWTVGINSTPGLAI